MEPSSDAPRRVSGAPGSTVGPQPDLPAHDAIDRLAVRGLLLWAGLVFAAYAAVLVRQTSTLDYAASRFLFEDIFRTFGDGHLWPRAGERITVSLAVLIGGPIAWVQFMSYYWLVGPLGGVGAIVGAHLFQFAIYLLGTPLVYRLLRYGRADRWVAVVFAAAYAISPFVLTRMLVYNAPCPAPFLLWSELGRLQGRPRVRLIGLVAATLTYPLTGFGALLLAGQDYLRSAPPQRRSNRRILVATAGALALVHVAILILFPLAPAGEHNVGPHMLDAIWQYSVFPFHLEPPWAVPVKLFEVAVLIAGGCIRLLAHPFALLPATFDLIYFAATGEGVRDHGMVLSTVGLLLVLGVRAGLFQGGRPRRNRLLVAGALFALAYGHAMAGRSGLIQQAFGPAAPPPHVTDIAACVAPGQRRCVVQTTLYPGFVGRCERVDTYDLADVEGLQVADPDTTVFVAPTRLDYTPKGRRRSSTAADDDRILHRLAARLRAGELHASRCGPWFVLLHAPTAAPNDPAAAAALEGRAAAAQ